MLVSSYTTAMQGIIDQMNSLFCVCWKLLLLFSEIWPSAFGWDMPASWLRPTGCVFWSTRSWAILWYGSWFESDFQVPKNYNIDTLDVDYILVTHGHMDHIGDSIPILKAHPNAVLIVYLDRRCVCRVLSSCVPISKAKESVASASLPWTWEERSPWKAECKWRWFMRCDFDYVLYVAAY